jgi:hypothetical protein
MRTAIGFACRREAPFQISFISLSHNHPKYQYNAIPKIPMEIAVKRRMMNNEGA